MVDDLEKRIKNASKKFNVADGLDKQLKRVRRGRGSTSEVIAGYVLAYGGENGIAPEVIEELGGNPAKLEFEIGRAYGSSRDDLQSSVSEDPGKALDMIKEKNLLSVLDYLPVRDAKGNDSKNTQEILGLHSRYSLLRALSEDEDVEKAVLVDVYVGVNGYKKGGINERHVREFYNNRSEDVIKARIVEAKEVAGKQLAGRFDDEAALRKYIGNTVKSHTDDKYVDALVAVGRAIAA